MIEIRKEEAFARLCRPGSSRAAALSGRHGGQSDTASSSASEAVRNHAHAPACETFRICGVLRRCTRVGSRRHFQRTVTEHGRCDKCPGGLRHCAKIARLSVSRFMPRTRRLAFFCLSCSTIEKVVYRPRQPIELRRHQNVVLAEVVDIVAQ
jgi:hypothetical protein